MVLYNIHMWTDADGLSNSDRVEDLIKDEAPDLVSLVEIDETRGSPSTLTGVADRLRLLLGLRAGFRVPVRGRFRQRSALPLTASVCAAMAATLTAPLRWQRAHGVVERGEVDVVTNEGGAGRRVTSWPRLGHTIFATRRPP